MQSQPSPDLLPPAIASIAPEATSIHIVGETLDKVRDGRAQISQKHIAIGFAATLSLIGLFAIRSCMSRPNPPPATFPSTPQPTAQTPVDSNNDFEDPPEGAPVPDVPIDTRKLPQSDFPGEHFPQTREREMTPAEVDRMTFPQVRYAINEVYARHGADFRTGYIKKQFLQSPWYKPIEGRYADSMDASLTETERKNLKLLGSRRRLLEKTKQ